ncbi:hypothetical protein HHL19_10375 [Streptomyces sp. R302]|uniref:hypothetical protein n=1 Tax=unclassified Streptomyces TaxID=2593676 RepID=UPI00145DBD7A|nr:MULTISPECIES: hypothetical protein [unclassified Streptomyces]NML50073.1 hypothetical protein [Streptomyces sp. R301]NML79064.1 hypothetical protein [Streptomyces sp. R302]
MSATTFTLATTAPRLRPHPRPRPRAAVATALRAVRAFGGAAVTVALLGGHDHPEAGVRNPRPAYAPGPD